MKIAELIPLKGYPPQFQALVEGPLFCVHTAKYWKHTELGFMLNDKQSYRDF